MIDFPEPYPARDGAEDEGETEHRRRRPRCRFRLTERGAAALAAYKSGVAAAHAVPGDRSGLEHSQSAWAEANGVGKRDALVLDEIAAKPQSVVELQRSLDDCGMPRTDIEGGIDRLTSAGFIEPATVLRTV